MRLPPSSFLVASLATAVLAAACKPAASPSSPSALVRGAAPDAHAHAHAHSARGPMNPPVPTAMAAELAALGLDAANLPSLHELKGDNLRKVMKLFTKSLGVRCAGCHGEDFAAPTRNKAIAEKMWDELSRGLSTKDGAPIFCDSCHQGHAEFLDRSDGEALAAWMKDAYVASLARRDGASHACASCHGEPFVGDLLDVWATKKLPPGAGTHANGANGAKGAKPSKS